MDKLSTFKSNDSSKLFKLAKRLHQSKKFFEIFLNDFQFKILSFIIEKDDLNLWNSFIQGNCTLSIIKDEDVTEEDSNSNVEDGEKPIKILALHIRYLLWEKAIDFYYSSQELDESTNLIEEVSDDYELINELDEDEKAPETAQEKAPEMKVREEEDDYDDDEDDEDDDKEKEKPTTTKSDEIPNNELKLNSENKVIIEIPMSTFSKPDEPSEPSPSTSTPASALPNDDAASAEVLEDQELLIKEFNKVYHNFEYDRETLIKRRKLEKSDLQLESNNDNKDTNGISANDNDSSNSNNNIGINLGSSSLPLRHLLNKIQQNRDDININDYELRTLFNDVRKNRGKWSNDERVGQEELYESCEKVALDLRGYTEHSTPFLNKVSKREAPNYGLIIKKPMDLNTVLKKLKNLSYNSKKEFVDDLMLIWSNCLTYNADPKHFIRAHALSMQKKTLKLIPTIPDITIRNRADIEKEEAELENSEVAKSPVVGGKATKKGRKRTREEKIKTEEISAVDSPDATPSSLMGTPKPEGTPGVDSMVEESGTAALEEEEEEFDGDEIRNEDDEADDEDEVDPELQAWRSLTAKSRANYCSTRSDLFDGDSHLKLTAPAIIRKPNEMNNFNHYLDNKQVVSKSSNLLENDEPYLLEYDITGGLPGIEYKGLDEEEEEKREQKLVDTFLQQSGGDPNKIKSPYVMSIDEGLNSIYFKNITEIQEIRKICFKISLIRQMQTQQFVHHTQMKQPEIETIKEVDVDPVSKLSNHDLYYGRTQYYVLRRNIAKIAMQTGYETAELVAINTLAQVAETYLGNLIKSVKLHTESNSSNKLKDKEVLLLSLLENGVDKPDDLYTFVQERIIKQLDKLKDLRDKLSNFLKELLRPGLENFNEKSFDDNSEQFMTGDFSSDLGDDFFGFKELGLDKEFKMLSSSIPIYLLHSRLHNSYSSSGVASKRNKYEDFKEWEVKKLYEADIDDQIGLLKPFYSTLLEKSKAHYIKNQRKKGESTELPPAESLLLIEDDELPQKQRNIRPRLPPTGKISSIKKRIVANAFFLPESNPTELEEEKPVLREVTEIKKESTSKPSSPQKAIAA